MRKDTASKRWLWELLQNARDCAAHHPFSFRVSWKMPELKVEHDAGTFKLREIVALVQGDSSKLRRGEWTGKYGKGFLVTHVISPNVSVRGALEHDERGLFSFCFQLQRGGSRNEIEANIRTCAIALDAAAPIDSPEGHHTEFTYCVSPKDESCTFIDNAIRGLRSHAPYLFAFIPELREVSFSLEGREPYVFARSNEERLPITGELGIAEQIEINTPDGPRAVLMFSKPIGEDSGSSHCVQMAFELLCDRNLKKARTPIRLSVATIFQDLPLYGTVDLDLPIVVNLPRTADLDSDRSEPNVSKEATRGFIEDALGCLSGIIKSASALDIVNYHVLTEVGISEDLRKDEEKTRLWKLILAPIVANISASEILAISGGRHVSPRNALFPASAWLNTSEHDEELLKGTRNLLELRGENVPTADSLLDWHDTIASWQTVHASLPIRRASLGDVFVDLANTKSTTALRAKYRTLSSSDAVLHYLETAFETAAHYCLRHGIAAPMVLHEAAIIPNQLGEFRQPIAMRIDKGVHDLLKDISEELGDPLRRRLVHSDLNKGLAGKLLFRLCGDRVMDTGDAVAELISRIEKRAGEAQDLDSTARAAVRFTVWAAGHPEFVDQDLSSFPLLCSDKRFRSVSQLHDQFVLPPALLSDKEREWSDIFPDSIRLSDAYISTCTALGVAPSKFKEFLSGRRLAGSSLLLTQELQLDTDLVSYLQPGLTVTPGHRVGKMPVTSVPGLITLLKAVAGNAASGRVTEAQRFFLFVLKWLLGTDPSWRSPVSTRCLGSVPHECPGTVMIYPCEWLGRLKAAAWLPPAVAGGPCETMNGRTIGPLLAGLPDEVFKAPAVQEFLALHCGVDRLELAIRAVAGSDQEKQLSLRNEWASVVASTEPAEVHEFVERKRAMQLTNARNGTLGRMVERLICEAFRSAGFEVERTGVGSDFRVAMCTGREPEIEGEQVGSLLFTAAYRTKSVSFLVEVKATKQGSVRMSWVQAETAGRDPKHYVLCVVDLADSLELADRLAGAQEAAPEAIRDCIKLVPDIGFRLDAAVANLATAVETGSPDIEVEKADELRFRISRRVWLGGHALLSWAESVRQTLGQQATQSDA